jgi:hypothetical protein
MTILVGLAIVGDSVGVAPVRADLGEERVKRGCMAELVLSERADRHVLLEQRGDACPLGVGEADDELVVGHREQQLVEGGAGRRIQACGVGRANRRHRSAPPAAFDRPTLAFGFAWPDCSLAAASLSRIT